MASYASYTVLAFGLTAFLLGLYTLLRPDQILLMHALPASALPAMRANALAAIAMGIYYTLASVQGNRAFFIASVPMRLLTMAVFCAQRGGWMAAGVWEGLGAIATAVSLLLER